MAAGSVAAGGLYMDNELNQMKNKKLQNLGMMRDEGQKEQVDKKPLPAMAKVKKLRDGFIKDQRRRNSQLRAGIQQSKRNLLLEHYTLFEHPETSSKSSTLSRYNGHCDLSQAQEQDGETDYFFPGDRPRKSDNSEIINVSGSLFLVDFSIFEPYPDTFLGSDRFKEFYIPSREEYFLERQKHVFEAVMRFYTNNEELICPPCIPKTVFESELEFYGLLPHYQKVAPDPVDDLRTIKAKNRRQEILLHIEFPGYSRLATAYAIFDLVMIILSTIVLVLESVPELAGSPLFAKAFWMIEVFVNVYFTIQTLLLISVYPSRRLYFSSVTNWIDIISILPFYLKIIAKEYLNQVGGFRVLRLIRLLRILKLFRHSPGSQTMIQFLVTSIPEIVLLLLMWSIGVLIFGPLLYFVELNDNDDNFTSAFSGMWFCVVTIGTVGYGDTVPKTEWGKVLAAFYTILNLTIMTIPISIIITKFNKSMKNNRTG